MSKIDRTKLSPTERLALKFVWVWGAIQIAERPIDRRLVEAKLDGMYVAAHAMGFGRTEFEVNLTITDTMRGRNVPAWQATGVNHARDDWELESMLAVTVALNKIWELPK